MPPLKKYFFFCIVNNIFADIMRAKKGFFMRKYVVLAVLLALCGAVAFARTSRASVEAQTKDARSVHAVGLSAPIWNQTWGDDVQWSAAGVDLMYHHLAVRPNRFSAFTDVAFGYSNFSLDGADDSAGGFNTRFMFGLGGAPVVMRDLVVAVHGTFGTNLAYTCASDFWLFGLWATVGMNAEASYTFAKNLAAFAGVTMYTNVFGIGVWDRAAYTRNAYAISPGSFNIDFRLGVAFVY